MSLSRDSLSAPKDRFLGKSLTDFFLTLRHFTGRLKKVRRIYIAYISCCIGHTMINLASHESQIKDILFGWNWISTPRGHYRRGHYRHTLVSLETQFSTAQRCLRRRAAHGRRQAHTADFAASLRPSKLLCRHLGFDVTPQENV